MVGADLPMGKTCHDCVHFSRCSWLIGIKGNETICDWLPSKFKQQTTQTQESQS